MTKKDPCYKIGSIVYIKDDDRATIIPAVIIEKSSIETVKGTKVVYKMTRDGANAEELVTSWKIFSDINSLQEHMTEVMARSLEKMINNAIEVANQLKSKVAEHTPPPVPTQNITKKNPDKKDVE